MPPPKNDQDLLRFIHEDTVRTIEALSGMKPERDDIKAYLDDLARRLAADAKNVQSAINGAPLKLFQ